MSGTNGSNEPNDSNDSNDLNLLLLSLIEESPTGALEPLVERTGDGGRHGTKAHPLRLRAPDLLLGSTPLRLLVLGSATPALDRVGSQTLA
jgi:hypothetical protein